MATDIHPGETARRPFTATGTPAARVRPTDSGSRERRRGWLHAGFALTATGALAATYAVSRGTVAGRTLDRAASGDRLTAAGSPSAHEAAATLLESINVGSLALVATLVIAVAIARRQMAAAVSIAVAILGACVSAEALKAGLGRLDPFGWETLTGHPGSFPSGHATVALVVVLAALSLPRPGRRVPLALMGGAYAAVIGVAVVLLRWHLPSDALGGFALAVAWMSGAAWLVAQRGGARDGAGGGR